MSKITPVKLTKKHKESTLSNVGYANWLNKMKKFTQSRKETCKSYLKEREVETIEKTLPTGARYEGTWDMFSMTGYGQYVFPPTFDDEKNLKCSTIYDGVFEEGEFQGDGEYNYDNGTLIKGKFEKADLKDRKVFFANGLEYTDENWGYCRMPDRRFASEIKSGIQPAGETQMTADLPTIEIADPDCYDTADGMYDKNHCCIYSYGSRCKIERLPNKLEGAWIEKNCRSGYNGPIGPSKRLYEHWQEITLELPEMPEAAQFEDEDEELELVDIGGWRKSRRSTIGSKFKRRFSYKAPIITFGD